MSTKCCIARIIGLSSNKKAVIEIITIARRVSVMPLRSTSKETLYISFGCGHTRCPYPNKTCNKCHMNYTFKTISKSK